MIYSSKIQNKIISMANIKEKSNFEILLILLLTFIIITIMTNYFTCVLVHKNHSYTLISLN